jgi:hypothetical protein
VHPSLLFLRASCVGYSDGAAVVSLGAVEPNDFFISTTSTANYTNDPINLIELNPLISLASSATSRLPYSDTL